MLFRYGVSLVGSVHKGMVHETARLLRPRVFAVNLRDFGSRDGSFLRKQPGPGFGLPGRSQPGRHDLPNPRHSTILLH
jgi:hypothetical protein